MWDSKKVLSISAPTAILVILASIFLSIYMLFLLAPIAAHIISVLSGYLYYRVKGCPAESYGGSVELSARGKRVSIAGGIAISGSSISSTVYLIRGRAPPPTLLLNPILLCIFSYFSPLKLGSDVYDAYGAMPGTVYIMRSRIGGRVSEQDIRELHRIAERVCSGGV